MHRAEPVIRVSFATAAALLSATLAAGYNSVQYHNNVVHGRVDLWTVPPPLYLAILAVWWAFALPAAILLMGLIWRRNELAVLLVVHVGWLFAVLWPPLYLWVWALPTILL